MRNIFAKVICVVSPILVAMQPALANHAEFSFPFHNGKMFFFCTIIADKATEVHIDTHNIDLQGACSGEYVSRPGHLVMPTSVVNTISFVTNQGLYRAGSITIDTPENNPIQCIVGGDDRRPTFGQGNGYC